MYHIVKIGDQYLSADARMTSNRTDAMRVDAPTFRAVQAFARCYGSDYDNMRLVTVTTRADRAARNVANTAMSDPQSAQ